MKSAFSIFFALFLLITQVGVSFASHYCGGKVFKSNISVIGGGSPACNMQESGKQDCVNQSGVRNKSCCEDHIVNLQVKDQFKTSSSIAINSNSVFLASFTHIFVYLFGFIHSIPVTANYYEPPILALDIPVLIQSFLI